MKMKRARTMESIMTSRGQTTVPAQVRKKLGAKA